MKTLLRLLVISAFLLGSLSAVPAQMDDLPEPKPEAPSRIEPEALQMIHEMLAAYRQLDSLSFTVRAIFSNEKMPERETETLSTFAYQKPRRVAVSSAWKTVKEVGEWNSVSNGDDHYAWYTEQGETKYAKRRLPSQEYGETALKQYGLINYHLDTVILGLDPFNPPWGYFPDSLELAPEQVIDNVAVIPIIASWRDANFVSKITFFIGKDDLLLRRHTWVTPGNFILTHTFSAMEVNPSIPESTFEPSVPAGTEWLPADTAFGTYWDPRLKIGENLFPFEAHDLNGTLISPDLFKGKVLLLHFSQPNLRDIDLPHLKSAYEAYHEEGFEIVSIALNTDRELLEKQIRDENIQWPVLFDGMGFDGDVPRLYGLKAGRFSILVGRDGKIVAVSLEAMRLLLDQNIRKALAQPE